MWALYIFGVTLGLFVTAGLIRFGTNPQDPPPDYSPQSESDSPDGPPPGVSAAQHTLNRMAREIVDSNQNRPVSEGYSPEGPPPGVSVTENLLNRNRSRIISIYNEMQSLNPTDPRRNELQRNLNNAGLERIRLYRQDANERGIPRETYINSILPNRG